MTRNQTIGALKAKLDAAPASTLTVTAAPVLQPQELFLQIGRKRYQVASVEDAVAKFELARDKSELGASQFPRVTIVSNTGTHLYGISYNGRVWDGDRPLDGQTDEQRVAAGLSWRTKCVS